MSAHLIIHDGSPYWWDSPDIWVVPGSDPNGAPGAPIAGTTNYLWARVANSGNSQANGVRIDFYWADPSAQIAVGNATQIGSAFADLAPGETQEVLCLVPWLPVIVNNGHECLLAVAHGANDINPIPDPLPNGYVFDPTAHEQIAQHNVDIVLAARFARLLTLAVNALPRAPKRVQVALEYGGDIDPRLLEALGLAKLTPATQAVVEAWLSREAHCGDGGGEGDNNPKEGAQELTVELPRGTSTAVYLSVRAGKLPYGQYQLLRVLERQDKKLLGGVTYLIVNPHEEQAP
ncbi:hypothetical protein [Janthinobacterium agaricidamnosum]|uniref:CARDB domain-containing protein n=1 Tax=Janthinobacterium agaricidamnosum NBRC 102515 = DSM 9628 TaxID=1349767 RepID=W0V344_9BURK|nr:hypothetical protein [Janthinobacterium agaricidamnosum]CDG81697.1 putative uncharacterized protein [Janthinobacterium agaricidamnosum NBRC 102515 = DSM 9628]